MSLVEVITKAPPSTLSDQRIRKNTDWSREENSVVPIMPSSTASTLQRSIKSIARDAQKCVESSPKKLRSLWSDGSMKRDLSTKIKKIKSTDRFVVDPVKVKMYDSLKSESVASSALEKNPSTETEDSKKSAGEMDIHHGFYT